jgi:hypothetical protein
MDQLAFSIDQFCKLHGISRAKFYEMRDQDEAPVLMHVGTRILISREAAEAWRRSMERNGQPTEAA